MISIQKARTVVQHHRKVILVIIIIDLLVTFAVYENMLPFTIFKSVSGNSPQSIQVRLRKDFHWLDSLFAPQDLEIDLHLEDSSLGHTGRTVGHRNVDKKNNATVVAIGMGITSKGIPDKSEYNIATNYELFNTFLPSFCATTSVSFEYAFYLAYDQSDSAFSRPSFLQAFQSTFRNQIKANCAQGFKASIHMVQCRHAGKPTWAQNDAMMEAYLDNVDYHFRINDDTVLQTKNWTEIFISTLMKYDPPNLGVVGPTHSGGNMAVMTYDFVHRTHVDVLGYYYPRLFTDWWGDDWVTRVYIPGRSIKLETVRLAHTMSLGQRYGVSNWGVANKLASQLVTDKETINRFINYTRRNESKAADGLRIIAMSLFGDHPKYTWGAIRNAQLTPVYFPTWHLRVYIPDPETFSYATNPQLLVPDRIVRKLRQLGADIVRVRISPSDISPRHWRYLVTDDASVKYFIIRDADSRLCERDAEVIEEWIQSYASTQNSATKTSLHCIRDHPKHADRPIIDGLWGGNGRIIRDALQGKSMKTFLKRFFAIKLELPSEPSIESLLHTFNASHRETFSSTNTTSRDFLTEVLWPLLSTTSRCHDSASCTTDRWPSSLHIERSRQKLEYLGQEFNEHNQLTSVDSQLVDNLDYLGCVNINGTVNGTSAATTRSII